MNGFGKRFFLVALGLSTFFLLSDEGLLGHGGRFKRPIVKAGSDSGTTDGQSQAADKKGYSFPGGGPQIIFNEARWEFWFDYNGDDLIGLRPTLNQLAAKAGVVDFPFKKISTKEKQTQLVRFFTELLRSESNAEIREAAVLSLARTRDPNIVPYIEFVYEEDQDLYVRTIAVLALGITENQIAAPVIDSIFNDKNASTEIRLTAALAMGLLGGDGARDAFKRWLTPGVFKRLDKPLQEVVAFGAGLTEDASLSPIVRSALIDKVSEDRNVQVYLILSLGKLGDRAANAILLSRLEDKDAQIRRSAAIALGAAATPSDKDVVAGLMNRCDKDADAMMKNFSYLALGRIAGPEAEAFLESRLDAVTRHHLPFVGLALGLTRNRALGAKVLEKFVETKDIHTRGALAVALGLLDQKTAVGELRKAVDQGGDPVYRGYCALGLGLLKDAESIERLIKLYETQNDVELHRFTAIALGLIGDRSITRRMYSYLESAADLTRASTAYSLGLIGDKGAIEPLKRVAGRDSETNQLRKYAVLGLGLLADERTSPSVSKLTRDVNYTILDNFLYEFFNVN